jgi:PPOX class probable F420-dependent enzyme
MAIKLNEQQQQLLNGKNFAHIATLGEDGAPQTTPVWVDYDGQYVIFNTEQKRAKTRNLQREPRVSLSIIDGNNPYHYIEIRGRVVEITEAGAAEHIDKMAQKYMGKDKYPFNRPGDVRLIVKIEPEKVLGMN